MSIPAHEAKSRLIEGNKRFINATSNPEMFRWKGAWIH